MPEGIPQAPHIEKFKTPEEEVTFLREQLMKKEEEIKSKSLEVNREEIVRQTLEAYKAIPTEKIIEKKSILTPQESKKIVLRLEPETHDKKMEEVLAVMMQKGIKNALDLVGGFNNPHLDDDFHRFLIQFLYSFGSIPGLKENNPLYKTLKMSLYEVTLPEMTGEQQKGFKDFLGAMEQFYAGMQSVGEGKGNFEKNYYTLEVAQSSKSEEVIVYAAVPSSKADLFEKQVLSFYTSAKIKEVVDDYNIFSEGGFSSGSYVKLSSEQVFPIRTYDKLDHDPMSTILNVFSKMKKEGEGASIQFVGTPAGDYLIGKYMKVIEGLKKGKKIKDAMSLFGEFDKAFGKAIKDLIFGVKPEGEKEEKKIDDKAIEKVNEKIKSTILNVTIRVIASAETKERANQILIDMESAFNQFNEAGSNSFNFEHVKDKELPQLLHEYSYRLPSEKESIPLNLKELSTVFHFPVALSSNPQLRQAKATEVPAPLDLPPVGGIILGYNTYRGVTKEIHMQPADRLRHMYVIGQTGTGKSVVLLNQIAQDIKNGDGCCFIDPHGTDVQSILSFIPPERYDDVIYFDPAYADRPFGLNMLDVDPKQRSFAVNELISMFKQLFAGGSADSMGPAFEQYFRNSALLVMAHPESGNTVLEIGRVLVDEDFREMKLSHCTDPILLQFWRGAKQVSGEAGLANWAPYITSKFDQFTSNDIMRGIMLQEKSVLNFREIIDKKKILLVNLSKGLLGDLNANLLGLLIVNKLQMAALSRSDSPDLSVFSPFYLYMDEFQNITTDSIASILSEARKYKLSLTMAHQFLDQLKENIRDAVFGNVGTMLTYRISPDDAEVMAKKYVGVCTANDITKLDNFVSYVSLLSNGVPIKPFSMRSHFDMQPKKNPEIVPKLKELSYLKFGRDKAEVDAEIRAKYDQQ